jgi:ectoine hydroxylase-related dioxygenase (phytanoyl-CoA dioxygenase family)
MSQKKEIESYSAADHAQSYKQLKPSADRQSAEIDADYDHLVQNGYVIIKNLLSQKQCDEIKSASRAFLNLKGRNPFEGHKTQRVYDILSKMRQTDALATHPRILGLMDKFFQPGFLLSQSQIINILPHEARQTLHYDDGFYRLPRPRQPLGAATIWAIDDFTAENGATLIIPKSHEWGDDGNPHISDAIPAVMPAGSVLFFFGTTWHGGGANRSDAARMAVTHQYCDAFMRQQENYLLELSQETVRKLSSELRALVGYSIYPPFMGMVNGQHPLRLLDRDAKNHRPD